MRVSRTGDPTLQRSQCIMLGPARAAALCTAAKAADSGPSCTPPVALLGWFFFS